jgi:hypothetical protein
MPQPLIVFFGFNSVLFRRFVGHLDFSEENRLSGFSRPEKSA